MFSCYTLRAKKWLMLNSIILLGWDQVCVILLITKAPETQHEPKELPQLVGHFVKLT